MSTLIQTTPISGFQVYGQQMVDYTVAGEVHQNFAKAVSVAAFAEASAIETEAAAFSQVLRMRQRKLDDLASCVAFLSYCITNMDNDSPESDDTYYSSSLPGIRDRLAQYGVSLTIGEIKFFDNVFYYVRRDNAERAKANAEYAMDVEDNDMQQDMVTLQGLVSKRDNSFSTAAKVVKKFDSTGDTILRSIGQ